MNNTTISTEINMTTTQKSEWGTFGWKHLPENIPTLRAIHSLHGSAPELYNACNQALDWIAQFEENTEEIHPNLSILKMVLTEAISKAEGKLS